MKKSINNKAVIAPLPVLIVCTYDENGIPDAMADNADIPI